MDALNAELRQVRRDRGEFVGVDVDLNTKHGPAAFAVGDRVQFTDTDRRLHIYNGNVGTITGLDARTGEVIARIDAAGGAGRSVTWSAQEFEGFRHGYAGTIYKGQGKTLDRTYLYHTEHWRSAASYVALTRQRESAQVFVARETARDAAQLARQMGRGEVRAASIAWASPDELARTRRERPETYEVQRPAARGEDSLRTKVRNARAGRQWPNAAHEKPDTSKVMGERAKPGTERQAEPERAYWQSVADQPGAARDEDRLRAQVRAADREQMRQEMQGLDRRGLAEAAGADQVTTAFSTRPMTIDDAARLVSRDYAAASDRTAALRKDSAETERSIKQYERGQSTSRAQGDQRWKEMGAVRQIMHKTGLRPDARLSANEAGEGQRATALQTLDARRGELAQLVTQAEKLAALAFIKVGPAAVAELAQRQERAGVAREVLGEQMKKDLEQLTKLEHRQHKGMGFGR